MSDKCLFCQIVAGEIPSEKVYETDTVLAFHDIHKDAPTHVLVIPKKHLANLAVTTPADQTIMGDLLLAAAEVARKEGVEQSGYRVITNTNKHAGQIIPHLHLHVLGGAPLGRMISQPLPDQK